jgi:tetratricopeptide (TPR) repeat protein
VCSDETLDEFAILETLSLLASKSLVVVEFTAESQRYRLLESLRQYGVERLKQRGEFDVTAHRHAEYFSQYGRRVCSAWNSTPELSWLAQVEVELDNIRAALTWSLVQRNNTLLGAALAECMWPFWHTRSVHEGRRWLEAAQLEVDPARDRALSVAIAVAMTRMVAGTSVKELVPSLERALSAARALGDERLLVRAIFYHGEGLVIQNKLDQAEPTLTEGLEMAQRLGDHQRIAACLQELSRVYRKRGKLERARELSSQALQQEDQSVGHNRGLKLLNLGYLEKQAGNLARAIELSREVLEMSELLKDRPLGALAESSLAFYHIKLAQLDDAKAHARSALRLCREQLSIGIPDAIQWLAGVAEHQGDLERAARLFGYAEAVFARQLSERDPFEQMDWEWLIQPLRDHVGKEQLAMLMAEGAAWSEDQAVEEALKV